MPPVTAELLACGQGVCALDQTRNGGNTGTDHAQVDLCVAPDGDRVVKPGDVRCITPDRQCTEPDDTAQRDEEADAEGDAHSDFLPRSNRKGPELGDGEEDDGDVEDDIDCGSCEDERVEIDAGAPSMPSARGSIEEDRAYVLMLTIPSGPRERDRMALHAKDDKADCCEARKQSDQDKACFPKPRRLRPLLWPHAQVKQQNRDFHQSNGDHICILGHIEEIQDFGDLATRVVQHPDILSESRISHGSENSVRRNQQDPTKKNRPVVPAESTAVECRQTGEEAGDQADRCKSEHGPRHSFGEFTVIADGLVARDCRVLPRLWEVHRQRGCVDMSGFDLRNESTTVQLVVKHAVTASV